MLPATPPHHARPHDSVANPSTGRPHVAPCPERTQGPRLAGAVAVDSDERVARAMKVAFDHFRLVLEPSGALALAAVLDGLERGAWEEHRGGGTGGGGGGEKEGPVLPPGRVVGIIACGGNTDLGTFSTMTAAADFSDGDL